MAAGSDLQRCAGANSWRIYCRRPLVPELRRSDVDPLLAQPGSVAEFWPEADGYGPASLEAQW